MIKAEDVKVTWLMVENDPPSQGKCIKIWPNDDWSDCTVIVQAIAPDGRQAAFTLRSVCEESQESFLASGDYNLAVNACLSKLNGRKEVV